MKEKLLDKKLTRRDFLKGVKRLGELAGLTIIVSELGCGPSQSSGPSKKEASPAAKTPFEPEASLKETATVVSETSPAPSEEPSLVKKEVLVTEVPASKIDTVAETEDEPTPIPQERLMERVLGGKEGQLLTVAPEAEPERQQKVLAYSLNGGKFFALSVYPDKIINQETGEVFEAQFDTAYDFFSYPGSRLVLLNLVPSLKENPEALPFVNIMPSEGHPFGSLDFLDRQGKLVTRLPLFERLQEGEVNIRFDEEKGAYEFLDEEGNVIREKQVFEVLKVSPTPTATSEIDPREALAITLSSSEPAPTLEKESEPTAETEVVCAALHVRVSPWGKIIGYLQKGDKVKVTGYAEVGKGIWYQIEIKEAQGEARKAWISGYEKYVSPNVVKDVPEIKKESVSAEPETKQESQSMFVLAVGQDAQNLSLSCESSAAAMIAAFVDPTPPEGYQDWEWYFIATIPLHCNPNRGFRGLIRGQLSTSCDSAAGLGYGVYAKPVAEALNQAGISTQVEEGVNYERVADLIKEGRPVIVWMSGKDVAPSFEKDPETGEEFSLLLGEHTWVVIGVSGEGSGRSFLVNDPWKGRQFWVKGFPRWDVFGGMRVVVSKKTA